VSAPRTPSVTPAARSPRIVDLVFGLPAPEKRARFVIAGVFAMAAHGSILLGVRLSERSLEAWSAGLAADIRAELSRDELVELQRPPSPPGLPQTPPAAEPPVPAAPRPRASHRAERATPPPPAQAAAIVAQEPDPTLPVDLTGNVFMTGSANAYAGGVTAASGSSKTAVREQVALLGALRGPDHSSSVRLQAENWNCPWPREADAQAIDEQTAVVRVVVQSDGSVESATIVFDPGYGFGQAAVICAKQTRFTAARDRAGRALRAQSPPIRVRFTR
jgi:protein TonB